MEKRNANVMFAKAGGNASRNAYTCRISLPKTWVDRMGLNPERREVEIAFDGDRITIDRQEGSPVKCVPLANKHKIRCFALVWAQMYKNHATTPGTYFEDNEFMGEGLADLGFIMDCGESFKQQFPDQSYSTGNSAWERLINQLDIQTLGNTIFSQWRYWNHWSMAPMEEADYQWFVISLSRLAELAK